MTITNLEDIISQYPTLNALDVLVEQERRSEMVDFLRTVVLLRLPNGKLCLDRRDRRILYMYIIGFPQRTIADKVGMSQPSILKRIKIIPKKILMCQGGHLVNWKEFLEPPSSETEASAPEIMIRWNIDSAMKSWKTSIWGLSDKKRVWKTVECCRIPEYLQGSFRKTKVLCGQCGIKCTRKKVNK